MVWFAQVAPVLADGVADIIGLSDLMVAQSPQGAVLYATSGAGASVLSYSLGTDGTLTLLDRDDIDTPAVVGTSAALAMFSLGGVDFAATLGVSADLTDRYSLSPTGTLETMNSALSLGVMQAQQVSIGAASYLYAQIAGASGLHAYDMTGAAPVALTGDPFAGAPTVAGLSPTAMASAEVGGNQILLTTSWETQSLSAFIVGADGSLTLGGHLGAAQGLGINIPTALEMAQVAGSTYAVVAAAGSSSLTVFAVNAGGGLAVADHIIDDLTTRFQNVTEIEVITVGGRTFVIAGGADDGVSLFTLLPGGQLLHLETLEDQTTLTLQNVTALTAVEMGDMLHIYAASEAEAGLTHLAVDLGQIAAPQIAGAGGDSLQGAATDDILIGGLGDDMLMAAGGADILSGGQGADVLTGGAGADIFILSGDGTSDYITDFQPGVDQIDLSGWGTLYAQDQLTFTAQGNTLIVSFQQETLVLETYDGTLLAPEDALALDWAGPARPPLILSMGQALIAGPQGETLVGSWADDTLIGGEGPDRLEGLGSDDLIQGGGGNDQILASWGNDTIYGGAGHDTISAHNDNDYVDGGAGNDQIGGGYGHDTLYGGLGNDIIGGGQQDDYIDLGDGNDAASGGEGFDTVLGGAGNDTLAGSYHDDTVRGGTGDDNLGGGTGADLLFGDAGNDAIGAGPGHDTVFGGLGHDFLAASEGADLIHGEDGNDTLNGGTGSDTLIGGSGADTFVFNTLQSGEVDHILDFEDDLDRIRLHGVIGGFGTVEISQAGVDTHILANGHLIILEETQASLITGGDFVLI